jgi:hypothetical protein
MSVETAQDLIDQKVEEDGEAKLASKSASKSPRKKRR